MGEGLIVVDLCKKHVVVFFGGRRDILVWVIYCNTITLF